MEYQVFVLMLLIVAIAVDVITEYERESLMNEILYAEWEKLTGKFLK